MSVADIIAGQNLSQGNVDSAFRDIELKQKMAIANQAAQVQARGQDMQSQENALNNYSTQRGQDMSYLGKQQENAISQGNLQVHQQNADQDAQKIQAKIEHDMGMLAVSQRGAAVQEGELGVKLAKAKLEENTRQGLADSVKSNGLDGAKAYLLSTGQVDDALKIAKSQSEVQKNQYEGEKTLGDIQDATLKRDMTQKGLAVGQDLARIQGIKDKEKQQKEIQAFGEKYGFSGDPESIVLQAHVMAGQANNEAMKTIGDPNAMHQMFGSDLPYDKKTEIGKMQDERDQKIVQGNTQDAAQYDAAIGKHGSGVTVNNNMSIPTMNANGEVVGTPTAKTTDEMQSEYTALNRLSENGTQVIKSIKEGGQDSQRLVGQAQVKAADLSDKLGVPIARLDKIVQKASDIQLLELNMLGEYRQLLLKGGGRVNEAFQSKIEDAMAHPGNGPQEQLAKLNSLVDMVEQRKKSVGAQIKSNQILDNKNQKASYQKASGQVDDLMKQAEEANASGNREKAFNLNKQAQELHTQNEKSISEYYDKQVQGMSVEQLQAKKAKLEQGMQ